MIHYIDFYIDTKTYEIHQSDCNHIPTKNKVYLGIFRNLETALTNAVSRGFTRAYVCNSCNILL
ncbi:hypothetical protein DYH56_13750 [Psychrilyobacter piezotolerans]|uniref:Uncharacterized protein n=1 Tax=Psychrilyobacter piezotolerans TaxID=2293438 RepID=A0ABX9KDR6_9FUSO|nr:hypothetical protein DV867_13750 [Psychrilyobacter sp. S5]REI39702.1 hypothetical protein DYH56_13750 [Psychrilyobacter piezotolerans]